MKINIFLSLLFLIIGASANAITPNDLTQEKRTVTVVGVFDGYNEEDGYAFLVKEEVDDEENIMYFTEIKEEVLKAFNLKSNDLVGKGFEITYEITPYEEEGDYGNKETYEAFTIINLKRK
jgi:hypothetical protein